MVDLTVLWLSEWRIVDTENECVQIGMMLIDPLKHIFYLYIVFLSVQYLNYISIFQLIALNSYIFFYNQHIKTYVLSKTLKISPTCFGHLATILREIQ